MIKTLLLMSSFMTLSASEVMAGGVCCSQAPVSGCFKHCVQSEVVIQNGSEASHVRLIENVLSHDVVEMPVCHSIVAGLSLGMRVA